MSFQLFDIISFYPILSQYLSILLTAPLSRSYRITRFKLTQAEAIIDLHCSSTLSTLKCSLGIRTSSVRQSIRRQILNPKANSKAKSKTAFSLAALFVTLWNFEFNFFGKHCSSPNSPLSTGNDSSPFDNPATVLEMCRDGNYDHPDGQAYWPPAAKVTFGDHIRLVTSGEDNCKCSLIVTGRLSRSWRHGTEDIEDIESDDLLSAPVIRRDFDEKWCVSSPSSHLLNKPNSSQNHFKKFHFCSQIESFKWIETQLLGTV